MATLVLVEDDERIRRSVVRGLTERGYEVKAARTGRDGLSLVMGSDPDAMILDLGLPDIAGSELLRMVRAVNRLPVIIATALDDEAEIIRLLDAGADDYVVKPFSVEHLDARLRAVLRRVEARTGNVLNVGQLRVDVAARSATLAGDRLDLTRKEFELLAYLASRVDQVVSKREILAAIWDQPHGGADKTVDVHLSWLRRKLGETAAEPRYLRAVRGVGVKLVDPGP